MGDDCFATEFPGRVGGRVVLLRGAPGVGKSACAEVVGAGGAARCVIEVDAFRSLVPAVDWRDRHLHTLALDIATDAAARFALGGFSPVLLVDCFGRDHAPRAMQRAQRMGVETEVVSLWAEPSVLSARRAGRSDGQDPGRAMALLINEEVRTRRVGDRVIDTSALEVTAVAHRLQLVLEAGA